MFCSNCGKQIPDGSKFCDQCGAQLSANERPAAAPNVAQKATENQQPKNPPKKKPNIIIILAIVLGAFLLGKFVIAPAMAPSSEDIPAQGNQNGSSVVSDNPAYDAIFDDTYIVHFQSFFNMEMKYFALKQNDGIICCADYGYKDDTVKQWVETMYIPVSEHTDAQKTELENTMNSQFAAIDALNCCTVTYKMGANYFTITCTYSNVDKAENYSELYNAQILQTNTFISMSATESTLLGQGFVKK